jgi:hypothetical protein
MSVITTSSTELWPGEVIQLLDDHHLVVVTDRAATGERFGDMLIKRMMQMADTQVVVLDGEAVTDVPSFCRLVELQTLTRSERKELPQTKNFWRDVQSVINVLRRTGPTIKRRYFVWHKADALLKRDPALFSHLVNALLGVAAEQEHIVLDSLTIQRVVFIGGEALATYAEDSDGQFHRWLDEEGSPLWEVASVLERPPVLTYRLEAPAH